MILREMTEDGYNVVANLIEHLSKNLEWKRYEMLLIQGGIFNEQDSANLRVKGDEVDYHLELEKKEKKKIL